MIHHVTTLETSKKLRKAGVKTESKFVWREPLYSHWKLEPYDKLIHSINPYNIPAYLLSELLKMVKGDWKLRKYKPDLYHITFSGGGEREQTAINAVAKAIIWQSKN